jgi:zinc D-Ala-D-Ala carboxypeptidase
MNLSAHFTLDEFTDSDTARRMGINNDLPIELMTNARATADMLERIRAYLVSESGRNIPIIITSGYRCPQLNRAIGSSDTSDHRKAMACDFRAPAFGTPLQVCKAIAPVISVLGVGQIIYEHTWVHVSTRIPDKIINRIITVSGKDYIPGIVEA